MYKVFFILVCLVAITRVCLFLVQDKQDYKVGQILKITGMVRNEPISGWDGVVKFQIAGIEARVKDVELFKGDKVIVIGKVKLILINENVEKKWLDVENISIIQSRSELSMGIDEFRKSLTRGMLSVISGDEGALIVGLVWGDTSAFTTDMRDMFRKAGLSHIVAASGFNVTLLASWVTLISARLFRKQLTILIVILSILLYMFLAGWTIPIIRAGLMSLIGVGALMFGRQMKSYYLLVVICLVMLIIKPEWIGEVSFQLSVTATAALIFSGKGIDKPLVSDLRTSLWVYVFTTPVILFNFGTFNPWGPISNLMVLWLVPILTQLGMVASIINLFFASLAELVGYLCYWPLWFILLVSKYVALMPFAVIETGKVSLVVVIVYYSVLTVVMLRRARRGL